MKDLIEAVDKFLNERMKGFTDSRYVDDDLVALALAVTQARAQIDWKEAAQELSAAYLRLRAFIPGAFDTPHAPTREQVWDTTEAALHRLKATMTEMPSADIIEVDGAVKEIMNKYGSVIGSAQARNIAYVALVGARAAKMSERDKKPGEVT
jgi:hypothetical protein